MKATIEKSTTQSPGRNERRRPFQATSSVTAVFIRQDGTFDASRSGGIPSSVRRRNPHSSYFGQLIASTDQSYQQVDNVLDSAAWT
ncbi:hypothetical protein GQ600_24582 [Phytophthora cactorum]|nr:hypothetical protein GQ600_24582 [Phytophthora cactorum]